MAQPGSLFRWNATESRLLWTKRAAGSGQLLSMKVKTMGKRIPEIVLAISVLAIPMAGAFAQNTAPATTNFQGATAAPTPDNKAPANPAAETSRTTAPGAVGTTGSPGSNDAIAGGQSRTAETESGGSTTGSHGGAGR
jgi:hypothetical protein